jgi:hypothetical protein
VEEEREGWGTDCGERGIRERGREREVEMSVSSVTFRVKKELTLTLMNGCLTRTQASQVNKEVTTTSDKVR